MPEGAAGTPARHRSAWSPPGPVTPCQNPADPLRGETVTQKMKQFACTEGTFSFIKHRNVFRKGPHGTNHTASIIVAASNSGVSNLRLSPLNANIKTFLQQSNIPRSSIFFPHKIKRTRNLAKSTVSGDGHGSASACSGPGASRWAQTALTLPPKCPGGDFVSPSPAARSEQTQTGRTTEA